MKKIVFKKFFLVVAFFAINTPFLFSQGSWDLKYIPLDLLNNSYIGEEVRLDFKSSMKDSLKNKNDFFIRGLLSKEDTITLKVGEKLVLLKENWNIYPDHGILKEQLLENTTEIKTEKIILRELVIKEINDYSIVLEAKVYSDINCVKNKDCQNFIEEEVHVNKSKLKGLFTKIPR